MNLKEKCDQEYMEYHSQHIDDIISPYYVTWSDMLDIASKIKIGKASAGILVQDRNISYSVLRILCIIFKCCSMACYSTRTYLLSS